MRRFRATRWQRPSACSTTAATTTMPCWRRCVLGAAENIACNSQHVANVTLCVNENSRTQRVISGRFPFDSWGRVGFGRRKKMLCPWPPRKSTAKLQRIRPRRRGVREKTLRAKFDMLNMSIDMKIKININNIWTTQGGSGSFQPRLMMEENQKFNWFESQWTSHFQLLCFELTN